MKKQFIYFLILISSVAFLTTGCTSKKVDQENSEISELSGDEGGELESGEEFGSEDATQSDEVAESTETTEGSDEVASEDSGAVDELEGTTESTETTETTEDMTAGTDSMTDTASEALDTGMAMGSDESQGLSEPETPKPVIPLQKAITSPYKHNGKNINAIYVAREGDTVESVSQKIYGEDKTDELKKINPTLARREMKVGDKMYYSSPKRPDDETSVLTYYEDMGMTPEVYLSQPGDNIRTVSQNLLGHKDSWKEIWSLNPDVESKADLPEGTRLRYWPKDESTAVPDLAAATTAAPPPDMNAAPPPDMSAPDMNAAPPPDMAAAPPPMPEEVAPPPPPADIPPPPPPVAEAPPPPPPAVAQVSDDSSGLGDDPDQMMALGAGAILLLAAVALFIIIRKKRAKKEPIEFQTATHTQIE